MRAEGAHAALEDTTGSHAAGRNAGRHLMIDLFDAKRLDDLRHVERTLKQCVEAAGGTLLHLHVQPLQPTGGVTGVAVLKESHIAIHSWPESGYAALDIFMSGSADPARAVPVLRKAFSAGEVRVTAQLRGEGRPETKAKARAESREAKRRSALARLRAHRKAKAA